jgi:hypothetical protein
MAVASIFHKSRSANGGNRRYWLERDVCSNDRFEGNSGPGRSSSSPRDPTRTWADIRVADFHSEIEWQLLPGVKIAFIHTDWALPV